MRGPQPTCHRTQSAPLRGASWLAGSLLPDGFRVEPIEPRDIGQAQSDLHAHLSCSDRLADRNKALRNQRHHEIGLGSVSSIRSAPRSCYPSRENSSAHGFLHGHPVPTRLPTTARSLLPITAAGSKANLVASSISCGDSTQGDPKILVTGQSDSAMAQALSPHHGVTTAMRRAIPLPVNLLGRPSPRCATTKGETDLRSSLAKPRGSGTLDATPQVTEFD